MKTSFFNKQMHLMFQPIQIHLGVHKLAIEIRYPKIPC